MVKNGKSENSTLIELEAEKSDFKVNWENGDSGMSIKVHLFDYLTYGQYTLVMLLLQIAALAFLALIIYLGASAARAAIPPAMKLGMTAADAGVSPLTGLPKSTLPKLKSLEREVVADYISVVDGDTVAIVRDGKRELVRLYGIDAPETKRAECLEEGKLGYIVSYRVRKLLYNAKKVEIERLAKQDKYGRTIGIIYIDGKDLSSILLVEGLVHSYNPSTQRRGGWCDPHNPKG
jgi:micrococcal nuclease